MRTRKTAEPMLPTLDQLGQARARFEAYEPRDLFYRAATELVALALQGKTKLSVGEAVAVLLQTWRIMRQRKQNSAQSSDISRRRYLGSPWLCLWRGSRDISAAIGP